MAADTPAITFIPQKGKGSKGKKGLPQQSLFMERLEGSPTTFYSHLTVQN